MTKLFQGKNGGAPFPRTESEWVEKKMSQGESFEGAQQFAKRKITEDVFGHDFQTDKSGTPIERGKGSAAQPTAQHQQALMIAQEAEAKRAMTMGWHPGLTNAFDPRAQAIIDDLIAKVERLSRQAPRKSPARKKAKPAKAAPTSAEA
jgi:hypothetical protein